MFTGIVAAQGRLLDVQPHGDDLSLRLDASELLAQAEAGVEGESIAVNGVCLTARDWTDSSFVADVSSETLRCTSLGQVQPGSGVNLERALRADERLGGHLVSGHVDGLGEVVQREIEARSWVLGVEVPTELARYIAAKGSVCLDGVSLTVNQVQGTRFSVNIIPHTAQVTTIGTWQVGTRINVEVDQIARYLERLMEATGA
jgi:riboflavin synthase